MRVAWRQHVGELGVQLGDPGFQLRDFVGERRVVDGEFACRL